MQRWHKPDILFPLLQRDGLINFDALHSYIHMGVNTVNFKTNNFRKALRGAVQYCFDPVESELTKVNVAGFIFPVHISF